MFNDGAGTIGVPHHYGDDAGEAEALHKSAAPLALAGTFLDCVVGGQGTHDPSPLWRGRQRRRGLRLAGRSIPAGRRNGPGPEVGGGRPPPGRVKVREGGRAHRIGRLTSFPRSRSAAVRGRSLCRSAPGPRARGPPPRRRSQARATAAPDSLEPDPRRRAAGNRLAPVTDPLLPYARGKRLVLATRPASAVLGGGAARELTRRRARGERSCQHPPPANRSRTLRAWTAQARHSPRPGLGRAILAVVAAFARFQISDRGRIPAGTLG